MANKFIVFYKNLFTVTTIIQALLFITVAILGFSAINTNFTIFQIIGTSQFTSQTDKYYFYQTDGGLILFAQAVIYLFLVLMNTNFITGKTNNHRLVGLIGVTAYSVLIGLFIYYIVDWREFWIGVIIEQTYSYNTKYTNQSGDILFYFWTASLVFFAFPLIINLILATVSKVPSTIKRQDNNLATESTSDKLVKLKRLLDEGIISKEVFDEKSKKYIEEL
jgi:hypothetical protein